MCELRKRAHLQKSYKPEGDKIMRLHAQTATIENGFVHLPASAPWLADYLHELTVFPNGRHDDQVDSTAQFFERIVMPRSFSMSFESITRSTTAWFSRNVEVWRSN